MQLQLLKTMKLAEYHTDNRGHFGLSTAFYAHFTSPIRRYADLLLHRRLGDLLRHPELGPEHFDDDELEEVCAHVSKMERKSMKAEQAFVRIKLLRHMTEEIGSELDGVIVEAKPFGIFVQLDRWYASGLVPVESLAGDYYEYVPEILALVGKRRGKVLKVGMGVRVKVIRVDLVSRKLELAPVEGGLPEAPAPEDMVDRAGARGSRDKRERDRARVKRFLGPPKARKKGGKRRR